MAAAPEDAVVFSLADLIRQQGAARPLAPCLTVDDHTLSYGELDRRSSRVARALTDAGVAPGGRVVVIARNCAEIYELAFGCAKAGAVLVPLSWRLAAREVAKILEDAAPRLLVVGSGLEGALPAALPATIRRLDLDTGYPAWRDAAAATDPLHRQGADAAVALLYTSGTTGRAKGVILTHTNLSYTARMAREVWGFAADSVNLVAMPLSHIGGLGYGLMGLSQGAHTVILQQPAAAPILEAILRHGVTHAFFVPTVIQMLVDSVGVDARSFASLRRIVYGASPISEALLRRAVRLFGCGFNHAYGLTETAGTVATLQPADHDPDGPNANRLNSCGRALPWVELELFDPVTALPVSRGGVGEIWIRSGMNTPGYWNQPDETAALLHPDGWLRTGDAAWQDPEGYVFLCDRLKDMIVSGGENVYPAEVESVILEHPGVAEAAVIGVPHPRWGETVKAVVVAATPSITGQELIAFTRERLAHFKCPTSVEFAASLPKGLSGKVLKRELRSSFGRR